MHSISFCLLGSDSSRSLTCHYYIQYTHLVILTFVSNVALASCYMTMPFILSRLSASALHRSSFHVEFSGADNVPYKSQPASQVVEYA